ncbi:probable RNA-directed DNA polymerase from transposon X-element [Trichonephila clavipes]|nr:probable RNA-directed DNA polymerase from transposon X-element [Trichonephila clavipes]
MQIKGIANEIKIFTIRKDYVYQMLEVEQSYLNQTAVTKGTLEAELKSIEEKITVLEVIPGVSYSQALNPDKSHQMAAPGKTSSASVKFENNKNDNINTEALNAIRNESSEFGFLQAILEMRKIFTLFPSLFSEMKKSFDCRDFNANHTSWGCSVSDTRGNRLYRYVVSNGIDGLAPPTPTRFGTASATIIDYALMKNRNWPCTIDSIAELSSNHNPIKLNFPRTPKFEIPPPQLNTTWSVFTSTLANNENLYLPQASSTPEIESHVRDLTSEIFTAHAKASNPMIHSEPTCMQGELKHLFRERNRARKQQVWEKHLTSLDAEDGSLWGTDKAFRKKASPISALNGPNGFALSDTNKTELIVQSLESQFQLNDIHNPQKDQIITKIVDTYITNHTNNTVPISPALPSEKTAVVIPILKLGENPKLAESHRPISLLPILSKLAEKIISTRLNDYLESENILLPEQHGFRPRLSTTHQLLRVVE